VSDSESLISRCYTELAEVLAQPGKCEFTDVNDHFKGKHNSLPRPFGEDSGLYGQTN